MFEVRLVRIFKAWPALILLSGFIIASPVVANRYTSTNYIIDASTMNTFGGSGTSSNYRLTSSGGEAVIGDGTGGSYKMGQGYVSQLGDSTPQPSIQLGIQPSGLVARYAMDELTGSTTLSDSGANGFTANAVGSPTTGVSGRIGRAVQPSSGNYFQTTATTAFNTGQLTACAWVFHATLATNPTVISRANGAVSDDGMWSISFNSGSTPRAQIRLGGVVNTLPAPSDISNNVWHQLCMTYDGSVNKLFVDGVSVASATYSGNLPAVSSPLTIGARSNGSTFNVNPIDEVKIFNRALSDAEIMADYRSSSATPSGLMLHMPFDEGTGSTANDISPSRWVGTISGTPVWATARVGSSAITTSDTRDVSLTDKFAADTVSVSAWVKPTSTGTGTGRRGIVSNSRDTGGVYNGYNLEAVQNGSAIEYRFRIWNLAGSANFPATQLTASPDVWTHLVGTYDGKTVRLYQNGVEVGTNTGYSGPLGVPTSNLKIGSMGAVTSRFIGDIDEVKIFNRALSAAEVALEYNGTTTIPQSGLTLGAVLPGVSKQVNFDNVVKATASSGYNLSISQDGDLSTLNKVALNFFEGFNAISSGTAITTSNTGFTSIFTGSGTSFTANNSSPLFGMFARNSSTGAAAANMRYTYSPTVSQINSRVYMRINNLPASPTTITILRDSGAAALNAIRMDEQGKIFIRNNNTTVATSTTTITPGQWFRLELQSNVVSGSQTLRIFTGANVNGSAPTESITGSISTTPVTDIAVGLVTADNNTLDIDEFATSTNGWVGPVDESIIPAITSGTIASPAAWNEGTTKGLGFSLSSAPSLDGKWNSGSSYAAFPGTATTFYSRSGSLVNQVDTIGMRARVDAPLSQKAGDYTNTITITGTTLP